jgi:hypothetical protein
VHYSSHSKQTNQKQLKLLSLTRHTARNLIVLVVHCTRAHLDINRARVLTATQKSQYMATQPTAMRHLILPATDMPMLLPQSAEMTASSAAATPSSTQNSGQSVAQKLLRSEQ